MPGLGVSHPKILKCKINKIGTMYVVLIEILQGIKTFFYLKALLGKLFQTFYYSLKNYFEKRESQYINLHLPKTYANSFAKEILTKGFISNKVSFPKACLK
jgi:hypothetical protein